MLATPTLGQLRGSPASTRGVLCRRGVLSEPSSPSLEVRPRIGDLMTPPRSRSEIPAERRAGAGQPKARAALAGRGGGAGTAPPLRSVSAVPPRGGLTDSAPAAILGSGNCGGVGRGKAEFGALWPGGSGRWELTYLAPWVLGMPGCRRSEEQRSPLLCSLVQRRGCPSGMSGTREAAARA